jgi:hypothetical protein
MLTHTLHNCTITMQTLMKSVGKLAERRLDGCAGRPFKACWLVHKDQSAIRRFSMERLHPDSTIGWAAH